MKEKDLLDNEIWVVNQIEESKQEVESIITEKIKALEYEKTIIDLRSSIDKLNKDIQQVDYNKDRALESLEEDINLKLDDVKIVEDNVLEQKITDIAEENISKLKQAIDSLEKNLSTKVTTSLKEFKKEQDNKFYDFKDDVELELQNAGIEDKAKKNADRLTEFEKAIKEIENTSGAKFEELKNEIDALDNNKLKQEKELLKVKAELKKIGESSLNKIQYINQELTEKMNDLLQENEQIIQEKIEQSRDEIDLVIQEINNKSKENSSNIKGLEELFNQKLSELKEEADNNLAEQKASLTEAITENIESLEIDKIKENNDIITQKLNELESINEKKLEKLRKTQEKFIIEKVMELDSKQEVEKINLETQKIVEELENTVALIEEARKQNLKEIKDYVESRILRMKYALTVQSLTEEITKLKKKIRQLEQQQVNEQMQLNIEAIVERKVREALAQIDKKEARKTATKKEPSTIDDIMELRGETHVNRSKINTGAKQIANITKTVKKCQILNLDN